MASPIPLAPPVTTTTRSRRLGYVANSPVLGIRFSRLVRLARHRRAATADLKIQIRAFRCLHHVPLCLSCGLVSGDRKWRWLAEKDSILSSIENSLESQIRP